LALEKENVGRVEGNLASTGVPDIFRSVAEERLSGCLVLTRVNDTDAVARVWFRRGQAYHARFMGSGVQLGTRIVSAGFASHNDIEQALADQASMGGLRRLGEILIDKGLIEKVQLESIVRQQIEDTIFEILRWEGGSFFFEVGVTTDEDIGLEVSVENLVMEGARRFREWHQITRRVPSLESVPHLTKSSGEPVEVALTPEEWAFLSHIDGRSTVRTLASTCGFTDMEAARCVFGLITTGLLDLELPPGITLPDSFDPGLEAAFDELERALEEAAKGERVEAHEAYGVLSELDTLVTASAPAIPSAPAAAQVIEEIQASETVATVIAEEAVSEVAGNGFSRASMAREFGDLSGRPIDFGREDKTPEPAEAATGTETQAPPAEPESKARPVDPEVDTTALIREFSGLGIADVDEFPRLHSPSKARQPKESDDKGFSLFGRKKR
jgi:uncharacterized protein DUF4388